MSNYLFEVFRHFFQEYGYWAIGMALLLENAGVPVPGETILLFASFLAFAEGRLHLPLIILVGTIAATLGDNVGYFIGNRGGRPLLERYRKLFRIQPEAIARGEKLFEQRGALTVFLARFIFGMRIIAGPLAGVMRMPWRRFVFFNFLGAACWVTVISCVGFFFGSQWERLMRIVKNANIIIFVVIAVVVLVHWLRARRAKAQSAAAKSASQ
jgi:membrane protein DedA with SNARE-associated domain